MRETSVERRLCALVQRAGGVCVKVMPIVAGTPDRLVMLPEGRMFWVETKAPKGALRPAQRVWHARAKAIGFEVAVLNSTKEVEAWFAARMSGESALDHGTMIGSEVSAPNERKPQ